MSQRITKVMLQNAVSGFAKALDKIGMLDTPLMLQRGGTGYRLTFTDYTSPVGISSGFLGLTAREAYDRLTAMTRLLSDIEYRKSL